MVDNQYLLACLIGSPFPDVGTRPATIEISVSTSSIKSGSTKRAPAVQSTKVLDNVPMLDLKRQYAQIGVEVLAAVERVCASQHYILGAEVEAFERELADF